MTRPADGSVVITEMPTVLTLYYTARVQVIVPNEIARKLKEAQGDCVQNYAPGAWTFYNRNGNIIYEDATGKTHTIEGQEVDTDYKRTEEGEWDEEEESESESESEAESEAR